MEEKVILFAKEMEVSEQRLNPETGKVETFKYLTTAPLKELSIDYLPMPLGYVLGKGKDGKEILLEDLGVLVMVKVKDQRVCNEFKGQNLRRPLVLDMATLKAILNLKKDKTQQKAQEVPKK